MKVCLVSRLHSQALAAIVSSAQNINCAECCRCWTRSACRPAAFPLSMTPPEGNAPRRKRGASPTDACCDFLYGRCSEQARVQRRRNGQDPSGERECTGCFLYNTIVLLWGGLDLLYAIQGWREASRTCSTAGARGARGLRSFLEMPVCRAGSA